MRHSLIFSQSFVPTDFQVESKEDLDEELFASRVGIKSSGRNRQQSVGEAVEDDKPPEVEDKGEKVELEGTLIH